MSSSSLVPYTRWSDPGRAAYQGPWAYMPLLYLDELFPILLGRFPYGFHKKPAGITSGPYYEVRSLMRRGMPRLRAEFTPRGPEASPLELVHFDAWRPIFEQPLLGEYAGVEVFVCSRLVFDLLGAKARACAAEVDLVESILPGLEPGLFEVEGLDVQALGGMWFDADWTLTAPFFPSQVRCQ